MDFNADIDALNFSGQTAFHVVSYSLLQISGRLLKDKILPSEDFLFPIVQGKVAEETA